MASAAKIRLYLDQPLGQGQTLSLDNAQAHYLFVVMRLAVGAEILVFNGAQGEYAAQVAQASKRGGVLICGAQTKAHLAPPDLWLCFAPIKKARTDFIVEKATELGAARICPVQTEFTNSERVREDRLRAHAIEAAEQCGATFLPEIAPLQSLDRLLASWDPARHVIWPDEDLAGQPARPMADLPKAEKWAILIGPEGGFSPSERARLRALPYVTPISLGPRILRADTAAVAAITLFQSLRGDW